MKATRAMLSERYPGLAVLVGYFHEDYDLDAKSPADWETIVDMFIGDAPPLTIIAAAEDITRLLDETDDDRDAYERLVQLGCRFAFGLSQLTPKEWLRSLRVRLREIRPLQ